MTGLFTRSTEADIIKQFIQSSILLTVVNPQPKYSHLSTNSATNQSGLESQARKRWKARVKAAHVISVLSLIGCITHLIYSDWWETVTGAIREFAGTITFNSQANQFINLFEF